MRYWLINIIFILIVIACKEQSNKELSYVEQVFIYNDLHDTVLQKFNDEMMLFPEFKNWNCRFKNALSESPGYYFFEGRRVESGNNEWYHIELMWQKSSSMLESTIYFPELICYFRTNSEIKEIEILSEENRAFIDLETEYGAQQFKSILDKIECPQKN